MKEKIALGVHTVIDWECDWNLKILCDLIEFYQINDNEIREIFPEAVVARMDLDTARTRKAYETLINDFAQGRTHILIGTQMVSKGLDFDKVSVVGILHADAMLNLPDFRSYEHAFMMMEQVSGRAGRAGAQGHVVLQTANPELPVVSHVVHHDFEALYRDVIEERQAFSYPPFTRLIYVYLKHRHEEIADTAAIEMASRLREGLGKRVLGPDKPFVARVKTQSIRKIVIKLELSVDLKGLRQWLRGVCASLLTDKRYASLQVYYDVDPL